VFTGGDGEKNSRLKFAQAVIDRMKSHTEAAAAGRFISAIPWSASQFEILTGSYLARLQTLAPDDRSFSHAAQDIERTMAELLNQARHYGTRADRISEAYRAYVAANLAVPRCAGNGTVRPRMSVNEGSESLELFGAAVRGELPPLSSDETRVRSSGGEAKEEPYWQSAESKQIFEQCIKLRQSPDGQNLSEAARQTREWRRQLTDFLNQLAGWKPTQEKSEEDYYHQRAIVYEALLELAPAGDVRNRVLDEYVAFLKTSNVQQRNPVEWYWHAHSTLARVRASQAAEAQRLLDAYAASGNLVLALEAALDRMAAEKQRF
jgi:hypothetical protein